MAYKLSVRSALKHLRASSDGAGMVQLAGAVPDSEEGLLRDFVRVLKAEKPSDISDIEDGRLVEILESLADLSEKIEIGDRIVGGETLARLRAVRSVRRKKRVL